VDAAAWNLPDDILYPAMLLQFGPPPKKGFTLVEENCSGYVRVWGVGALAYRNRIDKYLGPMAQQVLAIYKPGYRETMAKWRRNQYLLWVMRKRKEKN